MAVIYERDTEAHLTQRVKAAGGEVRKVKWIGRRGAPDRLVMLPPRPQRLLHAVWVELKRPGGVLEDHQIREHERMRAMGLDVRVLYSKEDVDDFMAEMLK